MSFLTNFTSPILADGDFGIAACVGVAARLTVMLTLLGLVCLATNSVILPDGYPVKTAKQLATLDVLLGEQTLSALLGRRPQWAGDTPHREILRWMGAL